MDEKIFFWPHAQSLSVASYRLRCARVIQELSAEGIPVHLFGVGSIPDRLVLSKRYDRKTLKTAVKLKERYGTRIFLDICDNHFYFEKNDAAAQERAADLRAAIACADVTVVSSPYLGEVVRREVPAAKQIQVIGDFIEAQFPTRPFHYIRHPSSWVDYLTLSRELDRVSRSKQTRLLWFGNHGGKFVDGGMADLLSVREDLQALSSEMPISLTVVSNSRHRYQSIFSGWSIPTFYRPWSQFSFARVASLHHVAILPIKRNPFSMAKTSNRLTTSLVHGLKVVADPIPSYQEYRGKVLFSDWRNSVRMAIEDSGRSGLSEQEIGLKNQEIRRLWRKLVT